MARNFALAAMLFPLCVQLACSDKPVRTLPTSQQSAPLLGSQKTLWPMRDGAATVDVCWNPIEFSVSRMDDPRFATNPNTMFAQKKKWIRDAVEEQYNGRTVVKFVGWQDCSEKDATLHIQVVSASTTTCEGLPLGNACVDDLGTKGTTIFLNILFAEEATYRFRQMVAGVEQSFTHYMYPGICGDIGVAFENNPSGATLNAILAIEEQCAKEISLHEFGHAAGFAHEQIRGDITPGCASRLEQMGVAFGPGSVTESDVGFGDVPLGAFDEDSIMSYCRLDQRARLTDQDVAQMNIAYETLAQKLPDTAKPDTADEEEDDADGDETPSKKKKKPTTASAPVTTGGCNGI